MLHFPFPVRHPASFFFGLESALYADLKDLRSFMGGFLSLCICSSNRLRNLYFG